MELVVVSVLGADRVGIVAAIAGALAGHNANIVDIAQTVVRDIFSDYDSRRLQGRRGYRRS